MFKKAIAIFLILCGISSLSLLVQNKNFTYLVLAIIFIALGVKLFKKPKTNKKSSSVNKSINQPVKQDKSSKTSNKKYYTFKVAGVTHKNSQGDNIQYLIGEYVKDQLDPDEAYEGLSNKEILEEHYDDRVYEVSDLFFGTDEIELEFELNNPYDPNAIKVISKDMGHIGYVPKDETKKVADIINNKEYHLTSEITGGKYKYVDPDEDKVKIEKDFYGVEIEIAYE